MRSLCEVGGLIGQAVAIRVLTAATIHMGRPVCESPRTGQWYSSDPGTLRATTVIMRAPKLIQILPSLAHEESSCRLG
jgi:hypothetical protein